MYSQFASPMQKIEKTCIANAKNIKNLLCQCKKQKTRQINHKNLVENLFPIFIATAKKNNLHYQCKKYKKFALLMQTLKKLALPVQKIKKSSSNRRLK